MQNTVLATSVPGECHAADRAGARATRFGKGRKAVIWVTHPPAGRT